MVSQKTNAEWFSMIQECRSSGLTDKDWCREHGVSVNSFYYNVKKLKKLAFAIPVPNRRQSNSNKQEIVPLLVDEGEKAIPGSMLTTYLLILLDLVVLNDSMSLKQRVFTLFFCGNKYAICTKML